MKPITEAHVGAAVVATLFFTWYYYFEPSQANGTYLAIQNFANLLVGQAPPSPFGNLPWAFVFGFGTALVAIYGILLVFTLIMGKSGGRR